MAVRWKRTLVAAAGVVAVAAAAVTAARGQGADVAVNDPAAASAEAAVTPEAAPAAAATTDPLIEKGRYVAILGDCAACHTVPGGPALAGGFGLKTPFGVIYSPNITPDKETGIGGWTVEQFDRAMRKGKGHDGANLYPAFPYPAYTLTTRADIEALYAYVMAQPAVKNTPPENGLGFPFNMRILLTPWNWLFFRAGEFQPDPKQSAEWNRGKYIYEGLGHCQGCHTPKNFMGGDKKSKAHQGGLLEDWWAPDLTNNQVTGLGTWSKEDIVEFLQTGTNQHTAVYGTMTEVVQNSTSQMTPEDLNALATYMKSLKPGPNPKPQTVEPALIAAGKPVYDKACASCHGPEGKGEPRLYPKLAGAAGVNAPNPIGVARIILSGDMPGPHTTIASIDPMPAFARLSDKEVAAVTTYIRNSWGNKAGAISEQDVAKLRGRLAEHEPKAAPSSSSP